MSRTGRPRTVDMGHGSPTIAFRISGEDMDELASAMDQDGVTLSQLARMIVHGWVEGRRGTVAKRSSRAGSRATEGARTAHA